MFYQASLMTGSNSCPINGPPSECIDKCADVDADNVDRTAASCTACTTAEASGCTSLGACNANYFDTNGNATDGCEQGCPAVINGDCTACSSNTTCTAVTCDADWFYTTDDPTDGCGALGLQASNIKGYTAECLAADAENGNCTGSPIGPIHSWNVFNVTDFSSLFSWQFTFNGDITSWDTGAATSFQQMFEFTSAFNQPIGNWNTSSSRDFTAMFTVSEMFNQPIAEWDTGASTSFAYMFQNAYSFNQPIAEWDAGAATSFKMMFKDAQAFNQPIAEWDTGAATSFESMFQNAYEFNQPIAEWDTSNGSTNGMFNGALLMLADYSCPADGPPSSCSD